MGVYRVDVNPTAFRRKTLPCFTRLRGSDPALGCISSCVKLESADCGRCEEENMTFGTICYFCSSSIGFPPLSLYQNLLARTTTK